MKINGFPLCQECWVIEMVHSAMDWQDNSPRVKTSTKRVKLMFIKFWLIINLMQHMKERNTSHLQPPHHNKNKMNFLSFPMLRGRFCYFCAKKGHRSSSWRLMNQAKEEWAINKTPKLIQEKSMMSEQSKTIELSMSTWTSVSPPFTWMGYKLSRSGFSAALTGSEMRNWILLDSQSSVDLFCNPALVTDFTKVSQKWFLP